MSRCALVVDDARIAATTIAQILTLLGYQAQVAFGPRQAIESLAQHTPDVILLDIHMPGVDGVELCRYFRREPRTARVPIIAMTSEPHPETAALMRSAGANAFLPKPIDVETLERVLKHLFV